MTTTKFVVIEHDAKKAGKHFDIRFKKPNSNMWDSFACPKGIPLKPAERRMVIKTTEHTEKEAIFTGEIKSGYGAGILKKWDSGSCIIEKYSKKHIVIIFKGSKLKNKYHFISTGVMDKNFKAPTYLFFKSNS